MGNYVCLWVREEGGTVYSGTPRKLEDFFCQVEAGTALEAAEKALAEEGQEINRVSKMWAFEIPVGVTTIPVRIKPVSHTTTTYSLEEIEEEN